MPYKHQLESYRIINGIYYECWIDCAEEEKKKHIDGIKNIGLKYKVFKMDCGMVRIFTVK